MGSFFFCFALVQGEREEIGNGKSDYGKLKAKKKKGKLGIRDLISS